MNVMYEVPNRASERTKTQSDDRLLIIRPIDGKKPMSSTGLVDPRVYTGKPTLHAIKDPVYDLWKLKSEVGTVVEPLRQKWTTFKRLERDVNDYFSKRGLHIAQVVDAETGLNS